MSVPDEATRRQIVAAVTDHRNKLRWAAVVALNASWASKDRTPEEWPAWEERYRAAFRPQRDAAKARETARRILQYVKEDYEEPGLSLAFSALERELGVK